MDDHLRKMLEDEESAGLNLTKTQVSILGVVFGEVMMNHKEEVLRILGRYIPETKIEFVKAIEELTRVLVDDDLLKLSGFEPTGPAKFH